MEEVRERVNGKVSDKGENFKVRPICFPFPRESLIGWSSKNRQRAKVRQFLVPVQIDGADGI